MPRILVVEDEVPSALPIVAFLRDEGHEVRLAVDGESALACASEFTPNVLLCDWLLGPGMDGIDVARRLQERFPELDVVFMTGLPRSGILSRSSDLRVRAVLTKPLSLEDIARAVVPDTPDDPMGTSKLPSRLWPA